MNFWNTDDLAQKLANDQISEHQKTLYYIACFYLQVLTTIVPMYLLDFYYSVTWVTFFSHLASLVFFHLGALKVYRACAHYKKASTLDTFVVLGIPVSIKIQVGYWATYFMFSYVIESANLSVYYWVLYSFSVTPVMVWLFFELVSRAVQNNYASRH